MNDVQKRRAARQTNAGAVANRIRPAIVVVLLATACLSTIAFGAVDAWADGFLASVAAIIIVLWVLDAWRTGVLIINLDALCVPVIGLILIGCVQLLPLGGEREAQDLLGVPATRALSLDPYATRMFTIRLAVLHIFLAAALTFIDSKKKIVNSALVVITFGAAMAFFGVLQRLSGAELIYGLRPSPQAIPFGPFVNQHHFAGFMELVSGLAFGMLLGQGVSRERRIFLGMAAILMGIAVIFTGSRGGLISYCGVVAIAGLLSYLKLRDIDRGERRTLRMAVFAGAAALSVSVIAVASFLGGGEALLRGLGPDRSDITSGRTHFWAIAWRIFIDHPIIGVGHEAFAVAFTKYDTWSGAFRVEQAHNDYLQTLADAGILGFACVITFVYLLAKKSLTVIASATDESRANIAVGALSGCAGILIHSIFDFPLRTTSNAVFFILIAVFACRLVDSDKSRRRHRRSGVQPKTISGP